MPSAKASLACVTHAGLVPRFLLLTFKTPSRTFQIVSVTCLIRQRNHISLSYTGAFSALRFHSSSCKRRVCRAQTRLGCRRSLSLSLWAQQHTFPAPCPGPSSPAPGAGAAPRGAARPHKHRVPSTRSPPGAMGMPSVGMAQTCRSPGGLHSPWPNPAPCRAPSPRHTDL